MSDDLEFTPTIIKIKEKLLKNFEEKLNEYEIKSFNTKDILTKYDITTIPHLLLDNCIPTLCVLEEIKNLTNADIKIICGYRNEFHNNLVNGSSDSLHLIFNAFDFTSNKLEDIKNILLDDKKEWSVYFKNKKYIITNSKFGIGIKPDYIHLDTRGMFNKKSPKRW